MPTSARCLSFLGSTWNLISVGTEPKNSELRNTELLFFLTKIQIPFHNELPKRPEHKHSNRGKNQENYEPSQNLHLVPKIGHQTHYLNL